jgi:hypothetical protein
LKPLLLGIHFIRVQRLSMKDLTELFLHQK